MKISFYADIYPGQDPKDVSLWQARHCPSEKPEGFKRFRVDVEFPEVEVPDVEGSVTATVSEEQ